MLRACHRVLRPGGRLAFLVIGLADDVTSQQRARAITAGPGFVDADRGYPSLLAAAGFASIGMIDISAEYEATLAELTTAWDAEAAELVRLVGGAEFAERQASRRAALGMVQERVLRRYLFSASRC